MKLEVTNKGYVNRSPAAAAVPKPPVAGPAAANATSQSWWRRTFSTRPSAPAAASPVAPQPASPLRVVSVPARVPPQVAAPQPSVAAVAVPAQVVVSLPVPVNLLPAKGRTMVVNEDEILFWFEADQIYSFSPEARKQEEGQRIAQNLNNALAGKLTTITHLCYSVPSKTFYISGVLNESTKLYSYFEADLGIVLTEHSFHTPATVANCSVLDMSVRAYSFSDKQQRDGVVLILKDNATQKNLVYANSVACDVCQLDSINPSGIKQQFILEQIKNDVSEPLECELGNDFLFIKAMHQGAYRGYINNKKEKWKVLQYGRTNNDQIRGFTVNSVGELLLIDKEGFIVNPHNPPVKYGAGIGNFENFAIRGDVQLGIYEWQPKRACYITAMKQIFTPQLPMEFTSTITDIQLVQISSRPEQYGVYLATADRKYFYWVPETGKLKNLN